MLARWDGQRWTKVQGPDAGQDGELNAIAAAPDGIMRSVGSYEPNGSTQPLIEFAPSG
jgi:hypothetical protein